MTKREREQLRTAIRYIQHEDRYEDGMELLCKLAGIETPQVELVKRLRPATVGETMRSAVPGPFGAAPAAARGEERQP